MSETQGKRGPYRKSALKQEQIAEAVLAIIDAGGVEAITTAAVAASVGIPEPSVLYHFRTKDHLLVAALRRSDDELAAALAVDGVDVEFDWDALRIRGLGPQWPNVHRAQLDAYIRSKSVLPEHPARMFIIERNTRAVSLWADIFRAQQRRGLAAADREPDEVAWQVIAVLEGFSTFALLASAEAEAPLPDVGPLLADAVRRIFGA